MLEIAIVLCAELTLQAAPHVLVGGSFRLTLVHVLIGSEFWFRMWVRNRGKSAGCRILPIELTELLQKYIFALPQRG
jgi:hypothetical protein